MSAPSNAGKMKWRVRFDKQVPIESQGGGALSPWVTQFTRWAEIRPLKGGEDVQGQRLIGTQPALIFVFSDSQTRLVDPSWRAVELLNGKPIHYFALKTAADMERSGQFITFYAVDGDPDS